MQNLSFKALICCSLLISMISCSSLIEDLQDETKIRAMLSKVEDLLQTLDDGTPCQLGTHINDGKCDTNNDWCDDYDVLSGNCTRCSFWAWMKIDYQQGNHCVTKWWAWFLIFLAVLLGLALLVFLLKFCFRGTCKKATGAGGYAGVADRYASEAHNRLY